MRSWVMTFPMYLHATTSRFEGTLSPVQHALRPAGRISACGLFTLDDLATDAPHHWTAWPVCEKCRHYWTAWGGRIYPPSPDIVEEIA